MEALQQIRRRIPSRPPPVEDEDDGRILDDQEQEEVIASLRADVIEHSKKIRHMLLAMLTLAITAQLVHLADILSNGRLNWSLLSYMLSLYPASHPKPTPIPLSTALSLSSIVALLKVVTLFRPPRILAPVVRALRPFPLYILSAITVVGPALSLYLHKPWAVFGWWCLTPCVIWMGQETLSSMDRANLLVEVVSQMRYQAPGA